MKVELIICFYGGRWITEIVHVKRDERGETISWEDLAKEKLLAEYKVKVGLAHIVYIGLYHIEDDSE